MIIAVYCLPVISDIEFMSPYSICVDYLIFSLQLHPIRSRACVPCTCQIPLLLFFVAQKFLESLCWIRMSWLLLPLLNHNSYCLIGWTRISKTNLRQKGLLATVLQKILLLEQPFHFNPSSLNTLHIDNRPSQCYHGKHCPELFYHEKKLHASKGHMLESLCKCRELHGKKGQKPPPAYAMPNVSVQPCNKSQKIISHHQRHHGQE